MFGLVLYPTASLLINLGFVALGLGLDVVLAGFSLGLIVNIVYSHFSTSPLLTSILGVIATAVVLSAAFISPIVLMIPFVIYMLIDLFNSFRLGVKDGYEHGLTHVLNNAFSGENIFSRSLRYLTAFLDSLLQRNGMTRDSFQGGPQNELADDFSYLEDVPRVSYDVSHLNGPAQAPVIFLPLTPDELSRASEMPDLGVVLSQYVSLYDRLQTLDQAIEARRLEGVEDGAPLEGGVTDETMMLDVISPALLVKQYQAAPEEWKVVPASTAIINRPTLEEWLGSSNSHPQTRERVDAPTAYNGTTTRYRIYAYHTLTDARELVEAASRIRDRFQPISMDALSSAINGASVSISNIADRVFTFFGQPAIPEAPVSVHNPQANQ